MGTQPLAFTLLQNGNLYAAGKIRSGIWDGNGWTSVPDVRWWIYAVAELPNGDLFAGGNTSSQSEDFYGVGRFDGTQWTPFARGTGLDRRTTAAVATPDGGWIVGGDFESIRGQPLSHIARLVGGSWSPLGAGLGGAPNAMLRHSDGSLIVAGAFLTAGNAPANRIARWDGAQWLPLGAGLDGTVHALLELPGGDVLAGGEFLHAGGAWAPFVARWNGTAWSSLGAWPSWYVYALAVMPNGDVVAGGRFMSAGGVGCRNIARWDGATWSPLGSGIEDNVLALAVLRDGDLVAGGNFVNAGGAPARFVARWDGAVWSPLGAGMPQPVRDLAVLPDGDLVAAGWLGQPYPAPRIQPARWDGTTWTELALGGTSGVEVLDVAWGDHGELAFAGTFFEVGDEFAAYFARLSTPCAADRVDLPTSCIGPAGPLTLTAQERPWAGRSFTSTATGFASGSLAVALIGLSSPNVPLTWLWPNTLPHCNQLASQEANPAHAAADRGGDVRVRRARHDGVRRSCPVPPVSAVRGRCRQHAAHAERLQRARADDRRLLNRRADPQTRQNRLPSCECTSGSACSRPARQSANSARSVRWRRISSTVSWTPASRSSCRASQVRRPRVCGRAARSRRRAARRTSRVAGSGPRATSA